MKNRAAQLGQMTVELVLMMILMFSVTISITAYFRNDQVLATVVSGPWSQMQGMIECGVWAQRERACLLHPNSIYKRAASVLGETPQ